MRNGELIRPDWPAINDRHIEVRSKFRPHDPAELDAAGGVGRSCLIGRRVVVVVVVVFLVAGRRLSSSAPSATPTVKLGVSQSVFNRL